MVPCGHGWLAEHGMGGLMHTPGGGPLRQKPQAQWPVAALQPASAMLKQPAGHGWFEVEHPRPGHSQHTGGG
jgi:hypothetical protein